MLLATDDGQYWLISPRGMRQAIAGVPLSDDRAAVLYFCGRFYKSPAFRIDDSVFSQERKQ